MLRPADRYAGHSVAAKAKTAPRSAIPNAATDSVVSKSSPSLSSRKGGVGPKNRMAPAATKGPMTVAAAVISAPSTKYTVMICSTLAPRLFSREISPA